MWSNNTYITQVVTFRCCFTHKMLHSLGRVFFCLIVLIMLYAAAYSHQHKKGKQPLSLTPHEPCEAVLIKYTYQVADGKALKVVS